MEQDKEFTSDYEKQFAKGFSGGFILSTYEPELARQLPKTESKSPFLKGLTAGINQQQQRRDFLANLAKTREEQKAETKPRR